MLGSVSGELCSRYLTFFSVLNISFSIFQRLRAARASSLAWSGSSGRSVTQVNSRRPPSAGSPPFRTLQHLDLQIGVGDVPFHVVHHAPVVTSCVKNFLQFPVGVETRPYGAGLHSARNFRVFHAASCHVSDSSSGARTTPIRSYR